MTANLPAAPPGAPLWFWRVLVAFARREARTMAGYRVAFLVRGAAFAFSILALAFMSRLIGSASNSHLIPYGGDYLAFAVVGFVVMDFQQVGVSKLSIRIRTAQILGLLEAELATPVPAWIALAVPPVYELGAAAARAGLYFTLAAVVFGVSFPHLNLAAAALAVPLVLGAFLGLGLLSAGTTMLVRRNNPIATLLGSASLLLSGVAYPRSVLPGWLREVSNLLPLTHALELVRGALLRGDSCRTLSHPLVALGIFAAILVPSGAFVFVYALRRARVDGSLGHY